MVLAIYNRSLNTLPLPNQYQQHPTPANSHSISDTSHCPSFSGSVVYQGLLCSSSSARSRCHTVRAIATNRWYSTLPAESSQLLYYNPNSYPISAGFCRRMGSPRAARSLERKQGSEFYCQRRLSSYLNKPVVQLTTAEPLRLVRKQNQNGYIPWCTPDALRSETSNFDISVFNPAACLSLLRTLSNPN